MINNQIRYIEKEFLSSDELIGSIAKTRTLNLISDTLNTLQSQTTDKSIIEFILSLKLLVEDAYVISMYKFQFKIFTMSLSEEIEAIQQMVEHAS